MFYIALNSTDMRAKPYHIAVWLMRSLIWPVLV
jgi:hypothetical protein